MTKPAPINGTQSTASPEGAPLLGWSTLERAAIGELFDLGTALAVPYLTEATGSDVSLGCSSGPVQSRREHAHQIQRDLKDPVAIVAQRFSGSLNGGVTLLVPERLRIAVSGGAIFGDGDSDPALVAIGRFGEVLLTQSIAGLASTLGLGLDVDPPVVAEGYPYDVILGDAEDADETTFLFSLDFGINGGVAPAILLVAVTGSSRDPLKRYLHEFLASEAGHQNRH